MKELAALITAVAAVLAAVAWPLAITAVVWIFKIELKAAASKLPRLFDRIHKASLAGIDIELERVANEEAASGGEKGGRITPRQVEAATRIALQSRELSQGALLAELDRLCLDYDGIRRELPAGEERTRAMTRIIVKMRGLAPTVVDYLPVYQGSGSAGSRLAAVAMMQMVPSRADLKWLEERFSHEHPFIFFHAALALQNYASLITTPDGCTRLKAVATRALKQVQAFDGVPDQGTLEVLGSLISSLRV